ncbi:MAG: glycosyltransferase family 4 protein [Acidobacteriota bacterium]|nr:MAG: glycosyltransferase family 4 protein [Acidobacteriota bacterium]
MSNQNKPLRICHVVVSLDRLGGHSIAAARLIEAFRREPEAGIEAEILPIDPRLPGPLELLKRIKYVRTIVNTLAYFMLLIIRLPRYDVVQVYAASYFSFVITPTPAVLLARLYGKRVILHYHSGEAEDHLRRWPLTTRPILRMVDEIVVPSEFLVDIFASFGFRARAIYNIVDFDRCRFRARRPLRPNFLTNRLHEPPYNVVCALRAFALIQQGFPEARMTVAGDGWMRPQIEKAARELGLRNTVFIGRVPFDQMAQVYDQHDIYLNPANIDNMPGSITESFACGLAVVTTDVGGIPYIVKHEETGLMVGVDDHEAMAACSIRLLEDPELARRMIDQAYQQSLQYEWSIVSHEWIDLYRTLTRDPRRQEKRHGAPHGEARPVVEETK